MKKLIAVGVTTFVAGLAFALLVILPLRLVDSFGEQEPVRITQRIVYDADGKVREAFISVPSWKEYYEAVAKESGLTIVTDSLPELGRVTYTFQRISWEDALTLFYPENFEVTKVGDRAFKITKSTRK